MPLRSETVSWSFRLVAEGDTGGQEVSCEGSSVPTVGRGWGARGLSVGPAALCAALKLTALGPFSKIKESHVLCCHVTLECDAVASALSLPSLNKVGPPALCRWWRRKAPSQLGWQFVPPLQGTPVGARKVGCRALL